MFDKGFFSKQILICSEALGFFKIPCKEESVATKASMASSYSEEMAAMREHHEVGHSKLSKLMGLSHDLWQ